MQCFQTNIIFPCPGCDKSSGIEIQVPELNLMSDKMSEHASEGEVYFSCPECGVDYEGYAYCSYHECSISLDQHDLELTGDPPMYSPPDEDEWDDYGIPEDPHGIFVSTYDQMLELLNLELILPHDDQIVARMIFAQIISAMEAYLSDTLLSNVVGNNANTIALLAKDTEINKSRFSLKDIADDEAILETHVQRYLRKIIYHNLGKVHFLYDVALGVDLKVSESDWEQLHRAIQHRHDCVHRNGFDREGIKNSVFKKEFIIDTATIVKRLVDKIDDALSPI